VTPGFHWRHWYVLGIAAVALGAIIVIGRSGKSTTVATPGTSATGPITTTRGPSVSIAVAPTERSTTTVALRSGRVTAQQIAERLAPLGCSAIPLPSPYAISIPGLGTPIAQYGCAIAGESVQIDEWRSADDLAKAERSVGAGGPLCVLAKILGVTRNVFVEGENWTAAPETEATANKIKAVLPGSKVATYNC